MSLRQSAKKNNRGVTMIEVLVSVVVIAIGLLGIAGLQAIGLKSNQSAYMRTQAVSQITWILDRMRANNDLASGYLETNYDVALTVVPNGTSIASQDLATWKNELAALLPSGDGSVDCDADDLCTVTVQWADLQDDQTRNTRSFSMTSQL